MSATTTTDPTTTLPAALVAEAMKLPPALREQLGDLLHDSVAEPPEDAETVRAAWKAELTRRLDEHLRGDVPALDAKEASARNREQFKAEFGYED